MIGIQAGFAAGEVAEASRVVRPQFLLALDHPCVYVSKSQELGR